MGRGRWQKESGWTQFLISLLRPKSIADIHGATLSALNVPIAFSLWGFQPGNMCSRGIWGTENSTLRFDLKFEQSPLLPPYAFGTYLPAPEPIASFYNKQQPTVVDTVFGMRYFVNSSYSLF